MAPASEAARYQESPWCPQPSIRALPELPGSFRSSSGALLSAPFHHLRRCCQGRPKNFSGSPDEWSWPLFSWQQARQGRPCRSWASRRVSPVLQTAGLEPYRRLSVKSLQPCRAKSPVHSAAVLPRSIQRGARVCKAQVFCGALRHNCSHHPDPAQALQASLALHSDNC